MKGIIKVFFEKKGFGFIANPDGKGDVFVHFKDIEGKGFRKLNLGEEVEFEISPYNQNARNGRRAMNVRRVIDFSPAKQAISK